MARAHSARLEVSSYRCIPCTDSYLEMVISPCLSLPIYESGCFKYEEGKSAAKAPVGSKGSLSMNYPICSSDATKS